MVEYQEEGGFDVTEDVMVGDLTDVVETKPLMPNRRDVRVIIKRVNPLESKEGEKQFFINAALVDGIEIDGVIKYKGSYVGTNFPIKYTVNSKDDRWKLADLKKLLIAVGENVTDVKVGDEFFGRLVGKEMLVEIYQAKDRNGEFENYMRNFKPVALEEMI